MDAQPLEGAAGRRAGVGLGGWLAGVSLAAGRPRGAGAALVAGFAVATLAVGLVGAAGGVGGMEPVLGIGRAWRYVFGAVFAGLALVAALRSVPAGIGIAAGTLLAVAPLPAQAPWVGAVVFAVALGLRAPVALALVAAVAVAPGRLSDAALAQNLMRGLSPYVLLAIPLFILSAALMVAGGIGQRLVDAAGWFARRRRSALGEANVFVSVLFGGVSGSSVADAAMGARLIVPAMMAAGYRPARAGAITAASAILPNVLPPSIALLLAAAATDQSVGTLWIAGLGAGMTLALVLWAAVRLTPVESPPSATATAPASGPHPATPPPGTAPELGSSEAGSSQTAASETGAAESGTPQAGAALAGKTQGVAAHATRAQGDTTQAVAAGIGTIENGAAETGTPQTGTPQAGTARTGTAQPGSTQPETALPGTPQATAGRPLDAAPSPAEAPSARVLLGLVPPLLIAVAVLGGLRLGLVTSVEAGLLAVAMAAIFALPAGPRAMLAALREAAGQSGRVALLIGAAAPVGFVITTSGFDPAAMLPQGPIWTALAAAALLSLLVGTVLDVGAAILLLLPLLVPAVGGDPIHATLVLTVALLLGGLTPPVGVLVLVVKDIAKVDGVYLAIVPYLGALVAGLALLIALPFLTSGLANLF